MRRSIRGSSIKTEWVLCLLWVLSAFPAEAQSLTKRLNALLDAPPLNRHLWGIAIADSNGRPIFSRNADRLFIPASNTLVD